MIEIGEQKSRKRGDLRAKVAKNKERFMKGESGDKRRAA
jgi:hypothetical protein